MLTALRNAFSFCLMGWWRCRNPLVTLLSGHSKSVAFKTTSCILLFSFFRPISSKNLCPGQTPFQSLGTEVYSFPRHPPYKVHLLENWNLIVGWAVFPFIPIFSVGEVVSKHSAIHPIASRAMQCNAQPVLQQWAQESQKISFTCWDHNSRVFTFNNFDSLTLNCEKTSNVFTCVKPVFVALGKWVRGATIQHQICLSKWQLISGKTSFVTIKDLIWKNLAPHLTQIVNHI